MAAARAINRTNTMKAIRTSATLSLLLAWAGGIELVSAADITPAAPARQETPAAPAPKKPIQQQLTGTVVSVDKLGKTLTIQVDNLSYVLQITDSTKIKKKGLERNLGDVVVGEEIKVTVLLHELPNGRVEVAVLSVDQAEGTTAQGRKPNDRGRDDRNHDDDRGPFHNVPNPGNVDGPVVSPHR